MTGLVLPGVGEWAERTEATRSLLNRDLLRRLFSTRWEELS